MSDITDKYLTEQYIQEVNIGMRSLLDEMLDNIADLYKHLKKYKRQKDIRPFANAVKGFTGSYSKKFDKWREKAEDILSYVEKY